MFMFFILNILLYTKPSLLLWLLIMAPFTTSYMRKLNSVTHSSYT